MRRSSFYRIPAVVLAVVGLSGPVPAPCQHFSGHADIDSDVGQILTRGNRDLTSCNERS